MDRRSLAAAAVAVALAIPTLVFAQSDDLSATVRAQLLSDPRTSSLSPQELNDMVATLTAEAQARGMTAQDLAWQPLVPAATQATPEDTCGTVPAMLCALNQALGFDGSDPRLGLVLGVLGVAILLAIGLYLEIRHRRARMAAPLA